jgi:hypothetical protein
VVKLLWQGDGLDRLLDGRHAAVVEEVVRVLRAARWIVATEVTLNEFGERGSIDVFAFHPETRSLLVVEVKTVIADAQDLHSTLDRKVRLAPKLARDRGWSPSTVCVLLVVVDSRTNRRRVAPGGDVRSRVPDARTVRAALARDAGPSSADSRAVVLDQWF